MRKPESTPSAVTTASSFGICIASRSGRWWWQLPVIVTVFFAEPHFRGSRWRQWLTNSEGNCSRDHNACLEAGVASQDAHSRLERANLFMAYDYSTYLSI